MEKEYVYLIHTGCIYEGGGTREIFKTEENAIKFALMAVEQQNKDILSYKGTPYIEVKNEGNSVIIKSWLSGSDEITIIKKELK